MYIYKYICTYIYIYTYIHISNLYDKFVTRKYRYIKRDVSVFAAGNTRQNGSAISTTQNMFYDSKVVTCIRVLHTKV